MCIRNLKAADLAVVAWLPSVPYRVLRNMWCQESHLNLKFWNAPHAGGPPVNATCTLFDYATGWYKNVAYNATEVTCTYGASANMQVRCAHCIL